MKIDSIFTIRKYEKWPSWDLVYEWEDIFHQYLNVPLYYQSEVTAKIINRIPILNKIILNDTLFLYEMTPRLNGGFFNNKKTIPCLIDFYLNKNQINIFEKSYSKNPIVLISSLEVFDFLKFNKCKLNIKHLPLSISDKYAISSDTLFQKKYDLVLIGRQNPVLESYLKEYIERKPNFKYVYRIQKDDKFLYFTSEDEELGNIDTRSKYMDLMKESKCVLYSTPGIDGGEKRTNGFSQVTPRLLEIIACGCHVIARYKENSDTNYFELGKFSKNINSYDEFESDLEKKLKEPVNMEFYSDYLKQHYTSCRVKELKELINKL